MKIDGIEFWWNLSIKSATNIANNKQGLIFWGKPSKICKAIEFSCPADTSISSKVQNKINTYGLLIAYK